MRIAFVYDRVNKFGGAERVLLALAEIWPQAPLFTAIYSREKASWANGFKIIPSVLNKLPFTSTNHEVLALATPFAFESFDFRKFDVVLTITSSDAKNIITSPNTLHICYLLTPTRYLWNGYHDHLKNPGFGILNPIVQIFMKVFSPILRKWDFIAASRPDFYIAISKTVKERIKCYYKKDSIIIYPPVDTDKFRPSKHSRCDFFLIVSRLVPYKKIDYAISAFNELGWSLKIIGNGIDEMRLKKIAKGNIEFIDGSLTDEKLCWYYQNCKALVFPGEEDFGISAAEAQSCGKPVIGVNRGGISEIVIPAVTGEIYENGAKESLVNALKKFNKKKYKISDCQRSAAKFSKQNYQKIMKSTVEDYWKMWKEKRSN